MTDLNFLTRLHAIVDSLESIGAEDGSVENPDVLELKRILIARIAAVEATEKKKQAGRVPSEAQPRRRLLKIALEQQA